MQERHQKSRVVAKNVGTLLGSHLPAEMLSKIEKLPATAIVFSDCTSCSIDSPLSLNIDKLNGRTYIFLAGGNRDEVVDVSALGPKVSVHAVSRKFIEYFNVSAAPRVIRINDQGKISFVQQLYVPSERLHHVVNSVQSR